MSLMIRSEKLLTSGNSFRSSRASRGDDGGAPSPLSLPLVDQAADFPVQPDQLGVRGEYRPRLCLLDAGLDFLEEIREACRNGQLRLDHATLRRTVNVGSRTLLGKRFELATQRFGDVIGRLAISLLEPNHRMTPMPSQCCYQFVTKAGSSTGCD